MSLHSGLVWLADGFEKYDQSTRTYREKPFYNADNADAAAGDGHCPTGASHKLLHVDLEHSRITEQLSSAGKSAQGRYAASLVSRPRSARSARRTHGSAPNEGQPINERTCGRAVRQRKKSFGESSHRRNAWTASKRFTGGGHEPDLPAHPDLRYFDRHSRCYNNTHCSGGVTHNRPMTACAAGRLALNQCECCGEVTSMIRYKYAPTGSAMTGMNSANKTFLYPEKIMRYDSYTGRRRPSSAPSRTVCIVYSYTVQYSIQVVYIIIVSLYYI